MRFGKTQFYLIFDRGSWKRHNASSPKALDAGENGLDFATPMGSELQPVRCANIGKNSCRRRRVSAAAKARVAAGIPARADIVFRAFGKDRQAELRAGAGRGPSMHQRRIRGHELGIAVEASPAMAGKRPRANFHPDVNPDVDAGNPCKPIATRPHSKSRKQRSAFRFFRTVAESRGLSHRAARLLPGGSRLDRHRKSYLQADHRPEPDGNRVRICRDTSWQHGYAPDGHT